MSMQARETRLTKRSIPILAILCVMAAAAPFAGRSIGSAFLAAALGSAPASFSTVGWRDVAGDQVVPASGLGTTWVRFDDGVEIESAGAKSAGQPLALQRADFDGDGTQDLAVAVADGASNIVRIYRGNVGAVYPNSPEARAAVEAGTPFGAPFHLPPATVSMPVRPDFMVTGDLDGDGNADLAVASAGGDSVYLLPGSGLGAFGPARPIAIAGRVTALGMGEIDRRDGQADLLVGIEQRRTAQVLVITDASLKGVGEQEAIGMPGTVREIAVGDVSGTRFIDFVAATDSGVVVVPGRDSAPRILRSAPDVVETGRNVKSVAIGDFTAGHRFDVAFLVDDGSIGLLAGPDPVDAIASAGEKLQPVDGYAGHAAAERIVAASVSSRAGTDLIALDRTGRSIAIQEGGAAAKAEIGSRVTYEVNGAPMAVVSMRLNPDAIDDLVLVAAESATPVVLESSKLRANFIVSNTNDMGAGSLRDAITQANMLGGADTISFNIAGAGPHTISVTSPLPVISEALVIDGTTEPDFGGTPVVVLNGSGAGGAHGIDMLSTSNVKVSGLVIQNFGGAGILVNSTSSAVVEGCYIGTNILGTMAAPNLGGVSLSGASMATIGGTTTAARNVISGNTNQGIAVAAFSSMSLIQGNYIGVTAGGNAALGNGFNGIEINECFTTAVGDGMPGSKNVISAHTAGGGLSNGVYIHGAMSDMNSVMGNVIGLGANGSTSLGNSANGVLVASGNTTIGGAIGSAGNVVSANTQAGVRLDSGSSNTGVGGSLIGLDATGTSARGNGNGIVLDNAFLAFIGGASPAFGNVLSGNSANGIQVTSLTLGDFASNTIGLNASATAPVPNGGAGIAILVGVDINIFLNTIAANGATGISMNAGSNVVFSQNSIFNNFQIGIDLSSDGVNANDAGDADMGPNTLQNYPVLASAVTTGGMTPVTTVTGTINSAASRDYLIEFFINPNCHVTGFGEGFQYAGSTIVTTDGSGNAPILFNLDMPATAGQSITATASEFGIGGARPGTAPVGKPHPLFTSEFSACVAVTTVDADVSVNITDAPDPVPAGSNITYTLNVSNAGPVTADNTVVDIATPPNTTFQSASAPIGWSVMSPPVDGTGNVTFSNAMFAQGGPVALTVVVKVGNFVSGGTVISATSTISADQNDPTPSNNSAMTTTTVQTLADLQVTKNADVASAMPLTDIVYTVNVFGNGPDEASNVTLTDVVPTNTTFQSIVAPGGWTVMTPAVNGTGSITATNPSVGFKTSHQFMITVRVNAGVGGGTIITNTATVAASTPDPNNADNSASADVTVDAPPAQADMSVTRVASPDPAIRGQNLTYTVTVSNNGPDAASTLSLFETIPVDTTLVSVTLPAGWTEGGQGGPKARGGGFPLEYVTSSMAPNTAAVFTVVVGVSLATPDGTFLDGESEIAAFGTPDPNPSNNIASTSTEVGPPPQTDLTLDKTATPSTVAPGSAITYTLIATNIGSQNATDLTITDATPSGTTFVSASPSTGGNLTAPSVNGTGSIVCVWPGVTAPGASRTLTVIVNVSATAEDGSAIVNNASTSSLSFESDFSNNTDSVSVPVSADDNLPMADIEISTSAIPEMIDTGEQLVYTILVTNNGPDTAENVLLRTSSPLGTRFVSLTTTQGTVSAPPAGGIGVAEVAIGDIESGDTVTIVLTVNVIGEGGDTVSVDIVIESDTNDPVGGNNSVTGSTEVLAGNDVLLTWDPPLPTEGDERNPPLHLQSQTVMKDVRATDLAPKIAGPRNTLVGYNIYRSNMPNTTPIPSNFFASVPANQTTVVAPTAPGGSFFVVTAQYPNGESGETNAASGGIPEPHISSFQIKGNKVIINGEGFTDNVTVFIDGIPFTKAAKVKNENTRVQQKGRLLTGQSVSAYLNQQGGVILVSVLNSDTGIGTFLFRR